MNKIILVTSLAALALAGCADDAKVATANIKRAADNFEINRRVVFYNGVTDSYILTVEGLCSMELNEASTAFNVICKVGPAEYKRHTLVLSDNTSAFVEQLAPAEISSYHYKVTFKPQTIIPDIDLRGTVGQVTP